MELVLYPDERLDQKCEPVEEITDELKALAQEMYDFMIQNNGIGLAANQVGKTMRLIVVQYQNKPVYMFNPRVMKGETPKYGMEGCLSFPGEQKNCRRNQKITVQYKDISGKTKLDVYDGITAVCIQHEIDHLNGITFLEREKKDD